MNDLQKKDTSEILTIRYMSTLFPSFVTPFLEGYHSRYARLKLDLMCSPIETIITDLTSHTIDAGFVSVNTTLDRSMSHLKFTPVLKSRMVLGCSKENALLKKEVITPEDLQSQIFCLYNEAFQDMLFERLQFLCGPLRMVMRVDDVWAMHEAITRLNAVCLGRQALGMLSRDNLMNDICQIEIGHLIDDNTTLGWLSNPAYELSDIKKKLLREITEDIKKNAESH